MKTRSSHPILPIQVLNVKVFLIQTSNGWVLVDTGLPTRQKWLQQAMLERGVDPAAIQTIILTHGHLDHIGGLAYFKQISGAQLLCHESLGPILSRGACEEAVPRSPIWKVINGPVHSLLSRSLEPVQPDQTFSEELDLESIGLSGSLLHTPGHSPGSITIRLENGECLIGDLLRESRPGQYDSGLFYQDEVQIYTSLEAIAARAPGLLYLSHGGTMSREELDAFLKENRPGLKKVPHQRDF